MTYFRIKGLIDMFGNNTKKSVFSVIQTTTVLISGTGTTEKMFQIGIELVKKDINRVMVVAGKSSYMRTRTWDNIKKTLEEKNIDFVFYRINTPTPTVGQVDEAAEIASDYGVTAIIVIAGGNPLDTEKSISSLIADKTKIIKDIYEFRLPAKKTVRRLAPELANEITV
jgi:alcohol dehydrogenase